MSRYWMVTISKMVLAFSVLMIVPLLQSEGQICEKNEHGGIDECAPHNMLSIMFWAISKFFDHHEGTVVGVATFLSTLFLDLEFAIFVGVILSLFFFLQGTSHPHIATMAPDQEHPRRQLTHIVRKSSMKECPQLKIVRIDGSLFFGSIEHIASFFQKMKDDSSVKYMLLLANGINRIDFDGAEWLAEEAKAWRERGGGLYIAGLKLIAQDVLIDGGFLEEIGEEYFFVSKTDAIAQIYQKLDPSVCRACTARVFHECATEIAPVVP